MHPNHSVLNKQAISAAKQHMGELAWPTVILLLLVVIGFVANLWLFSIGLTPLWAATIIYAALTYMAYTPLHEAVHGNINGRYENMAWLNSLCGYIAAVIFLVPYASHKIEHFTHHRYTNQPDKDPDYIVRNMGNNLFTMITTGFQFLWVQCTFLFHEHWAKASLRERITYCAEIFVSLGWRVAFVAFIGREFDWLLLLLGYFIGGFFTAYWFAYRPHAPYDNSQRYQNTNSLIMPTWMKPLEWFWLGQNLHSMHHLFPRVPFYRYHALHREIEPVVRELGTPIIGAFSREPIAPKGG